MRAATSEPLASRVSRLVDDLAPQRVIVLGSPPPHGRDLDLLVPASGRARLERDLLTHGLIPRGRTLACFADCTAYGVELIEAEQYLPPAALDDLFREARPLAEFRHFAEPAPQHALLILARLVAGEGELAPKRRRRLDRILAADPHAWEGAGRIASSWNASAQLRGLRTLANQTEPASGVQGTAAGMARSQAARMGRALRRVRRGFLVSLSGLDGSGKSSQAAWLVEGLRELGIPAEVAWNDLQGNLAGDLVAKPLRALLAATGRRPTEFSSYGGTPPPPGAGPSGEVEREQASRSAWRYEVPREAWSAYVTLTDGLEQRWQALRHQVRGRVVVFDRGPLDLAVRMKVLYRTSKAGQTAIARLAAPRPDVSFLLEIPPEVSLQRKDDIWSLAQLSEHAAIYSSLADGFSARRLDGTRPAAELAAEIGAAVWSALE